MRLFTGLWLCFVGCGLAAADDTPIFRSDVSMGRIDTLVLDRTQHPIGGLNKEDFILRKGGTPIPIRNLAYEDLPVDVLLLLDVSGSMGVHVQKVASAAHEALAVLGNQDRVGIMVFTTHTRLRLPFRQDLREVERRLDDIVDSESFNGGTNINGALPGRRRLCGTRRPASGAACHRHRDRRSGAPLRSDPRVGRIGSGGCRFDGAFSAGIHGTLSRGRISGRAASSYGTLAGRRWPRRAFGRSYPGAPSRYFQRSWFAPCGDRESSRDLSRLAVDCPCLRRRLAGCE